jgi:hypothetical protein
MGSITKDWETILAESTTKDSDVAPGVAIAAVDKNGKGVIHRLVSESQLLPQKHNFLLTHNSQATSSTKRSQATTAKRPTPNP